MFLHFNVVRQFRPAFLRVQWTHYECRLSPAASSLSLLLVSVELGSTYRRWLHRQDASFSRGQGEIFPITSCFFLRVNKVLDSGFLEGSLTRLGKTERREEFLFLFLFSLYFLLRQSSPYERREHACVLETVRFIATVNDWANYYLQAFTRMTALLMWWLILIR